MTKIEIAYEVDAAAVERVKAMLGEVAVRDINFNGEEFEVVRGDFTCIPDNDDPKYIPIYHAVMREIEGKIEGGYDSE